MKRYLVLVFVAVALGAYSSETQIGKSGGASVLGPLGSYCVNRDDFAGLAAVIATRRGCQPPARTGEAATGAPAATDDRTRPR